MLRRERGRTYVADSWKPYEVGVSRICQLGSAASRRARGRNAHGVEQRLSIEKDYRGVGVELRDRSDESSESGVVQGEMVCEGGDRFCAVRLDERSALSGWDTEDKKVAGWGGASARAGEF